MLRRKKGVTEERVREIAREEMRVPARVFFDLYRSAGVINDDGSLAEGVEFTRDPQDGSPVLVYQGD